MVELLKRLSRDENGMILCSEVVLVGTILVLGAIAGLSALSYAVNAELTDAANACAGYNQSGYGYGNGSGSRRGGSGNSHYTLTSTPGMPEVVGY